MEGNEYKEYEIHYVRNGEAKKTSLKLTKKPSDGEVWVILMNTLKFLIPDSPDGQRQTSEDICREHGITEATVRQEGLSS